MHPAPLTLRQTRLARSTLTRPLLLRQHRSYYSARSAASASFTTDPRRCATSSAAAAVAAASIYFFTMQTAGAACIRNSPSTSSSSPHESVRCYIYGAMQPAERSSCERQREREAPLFSYSQGFLFPNCIIWGVVPQQRHGNFSHSSFCSLHATLSHPQKYVAIFF
jgi:hypothetical protein